MEAQEANHRTLYWGCRWTGRIRRTLDKLRLGRFELQTVCGNICLRDYGLWLSSASSCSRICWNHTHTYVLSCDLHYACLCLFLVLGNERNHYERLLATISDCQQRSAIVGDCRQRLATIGDSRRRSAIVGNNRRQLSNSAMIWAQKSALLGFHKYGIMPPLEFIHCVYLPLLRFAHMNLSHLEENPEINPVHMIFEFSHMIWCPHWL